MTTAAKTALAREAVGAAGGRVMEEVFADGFESGGVTRWN